MKKLIESISNAEIYEIDRGTASPSEKARRLKIMAENNNAYKAYEKRVSPALLNASIEIKRLIDQKITPALLSNLGLILDNRFHDVYCDVKVYPNSEEQDAFTIDDEESGWNENNLHVLVNFVVSIPKDDSLDSMARATLLSLFQEEEDWTDSNPTFSKIKKKLKLYKLLNIDVISGKMGDIPFNDFDTDGCGVNLEIDCDGIVCSKFEKLKNASLGPEIQSKRISQVKKSLELKEITIKNAGKEVPVLIAKILDALGTKNIDPAKLKKTDNLYALCAYQDKTCLSLTHSIRMHFDVLSIIGGQDMVTVQDGINFAIETLEMREDD
jgi:hypothetical protein